MNFEFSEEQNELREHIAGMLEKACPLDGVHKALAGDAGVGRVLWNQLADLGYLGLAVPETFGGAGLSRLEQCILSEELGRVLAPAPSVGSLYLFTELVRACGSEEQRERLMPQLASGAITGSFAGYEGILAPLDARTRFDSGSQFVDGEKWPAIDALEATHVMLTARDESGDVGLYVVALDDESSSRILLESFDPSRPLCRLLFENTAADKLGSFSDGTSARAFNHEYRKALDNAAVFIAFEQLGLAQAALRTGIDYALERRAFGRVIGSYQAVKHRLVDMYSRIEIARSHAYFAAWATEHQNSELAAASRLALVAANDAANFASRENIIVHGGYGFTAEASCHLYLKRAQQTATLLGPSASMKAQIFRDMLEVANHADRDIRSSAEGSDHGL